MDCSKSMKTPSGFPNFFIIGAPKCGTTALSEYLRRHPDIAFSEPKEPHYFNDDSLHRYTHTLRDYMECFAGRTGKELAIGEGSAHYLHSKTAVPNILRYMPSAKFIVMLRNPIEAAYSMHWQCRYILEEDIVDFEEAWFAQDDRAQGRRLPKHNTIREALQYGSLFKYGEQLERLYERVRRERIHVILFDDLTSNPGGIYSKVLNFLEVPDIKLPNYDVVNSSKKVRYPVIELLGRKGLALKRALGVGRSFGLLRWNTKYETRPSLSPAFRSQLRDYYRADTLRASRLLGLDLGSWLGD